MHLLCEGKKEGSLALSLSITKTKSKSPPLQLTRICMSKLCIRETIIE